MENKNKTIYSLSTATNSKICYNHSLYINNGYNIGVIQQGDTELSHIIKSIKHSKERDIYITLESLDILCIYEFYRLTKSKNILITTNENKLIQAIVEQKKTNLIQFEEKTNTIQPATIKMPYKLVRELQVNGFKQPLVFQALLDKLIKYKAAGNDIFFTVKVNFIPNISIYNSILEAVAKEYNSFISIESSNNHLDEKVEKLCQIFKNGINSFKEQYPGTISKDNSIFFTEQIDINIKKSLTHLFTYLYSYTDKKKDQIGLFCVISAIALNISIFVVAVTSVCVILTVGIIALFFALFYSLVSNVLGSRTIDIEQKDIDDLLNDLFFVSLLQNFGTSILPFQEYNYCIRGNYLYSNNFINIYSSNSNKKTLKQYYIRCSDNRLNNQYIKEITDNLFCILNKKQEYSEKVSLLKPQYQEKIKKDEDKFYNELISNPFISFTNQQYEETFANYIISYTLFNRQKMFPAYERYLELFYENKHEIFETSVASLTSLMYVETPYYSTTLLNDIIAKVQNNNINYEQISSPKSIIFVTNPVTSGKSSVIKNELKDKFHIKIDYISYGHGAEDTLRGYGVEDYQFYDMIIDNKLQETSSMYIMYFSTFQYCSFNRINKESINMANNQNYIVNNELGFNYKQLDIDSDYYIPDNCNNSDIRMNYKHLSKIVDNINIYNQLLKHLNTDFFYDINEFNKFNSYMNSKYKKEISEINKSANYLHSKLSYFFNSTELEDYDYMLKLKKEFLYNTIDKYLKTYRKDLFCTYDYNLSISFNKLYITNYFQGDIQFVFLLVTNLAKYNLFDGLDTLIKYYTEESNKKLEDTGKNIVNQFINSLSNQKHTNIKLNELIQKLIKRILFCYGIDEYIENLIKHRYSNYSVENMLEQIFYIIVGQNYHSNSAVEKIVMKHIMNSAYEKYSYIFSVEFFAKEIYFILDKLTIDSNIIYNDLKNEIKALYNIDNTYISIVETFLQSYIGDKIIIEQQSENDIEHHNLNNNKAMSASNWLHTIMFSAVDIFGVFKEINNIKFSTIAGLSVTLSSALAGYIVTALLNIPDKEKLQEYIDLYNFLYIDSKSLPPNTVINNNVICTPVEVNNNMAIFDRHTLLFGDKNMDINSFHNTFSLYANIYDEQNVSAVFKERMYTLLTGYGIKDLDNVLLEKYAKEHKYSNYGAGALKAWDYIAKEHKNQKKDEPLEIDIKTIKNMLGLKDEEIENNTITKEISEEMYSTYTDKPIDTPATVVAKSFYHAVCYVEGYIPDDNLMPKKEAVVESLKDEEGKRNFTFTESLHEIAKQNLYSAYTIEDNKKDDETQFKDTIIRNQQPFIGIITLWVLPKNLAGEN